MKKLVVVDTCSFIDYFRGSTESPIPALASQDAILLSKVVRLELLKGASRDDRHALINFFEGLRSTPGFPDPDLTEKYLFQLHGRGFNLGIPDVIRGHSGNLRPRVSRVRESRRGGPYFTPYRPG